MFYLSGSIKLNGNLFGIEPLEEDRLFSLSDYVIEGGVKDLQNTSSGIILGAGVAKKMSVKLNERIQVTSATGEQFSLKIVGIYQSGLAEIDDIQSYVNLKMAQKILGEPDNFITDINVKLYDMEKAGRLSNEWRERFELSAIDIKTANAQFETGTKIRNIITYAVFHNAINCCGFRNIQHPKHAHL